MADGYDELITAIVRQAVKDYIIALKTNNHSQIRNLERFFRGEWGQALSLGKGEYIIKRCKMIAETK